MRRPRRTPWRKIPEHIKARVIAALRRDTDELVQRNQAKELTSAELTQETPTTGTTDTEVVAEV